MWIKAITYINNKVQKIDLKFSNHKVLKCKQHSLETIRYKFLFALNEEFGEGRPWTLIGSLEVTNEQHIITSTFDKLYFINNDNKNIVQTEQHTRTIMPATPNELQSMVGSLMFIKGYNINDDTKPWSWVTYLSSTNEEKTENLFQGCETITDICQRRDFILL